MNTNLSPPRRGFLVSRTDETDRTASLPRLDIMGPSFLVMEPHLLGIPKQKLPKVSSPRKEGSGKTLEKLSPRKTPFGSLSSNFKDKCSVKSLSDAESSCTTQASTTSQTSPPQRGTRRVKFQRDHKGCITGRPMPARKKELTLYEIKQTWWTRTELRKCRERAQDMCREILETEMEYKMAVVRILNRCGAEHKTGIESYQYYNQIFEEDVGLDQSLEKEAEDLKKVVEYAETARGLEKRLLNVMDVPFHRHKRSVQTVIDTQRKMRHNECSFEDTEREVATRYKKYCQYAVSWASLIAECDAAAAGIRAMI